MTDRRNDTSAALTEARTVLSRTETAIDTINSNGGKSEHRHIDARLVDGDYEPGYFEHYRDPDADEMVEIMTEFVRKMEKFSGRRKRTR